MEQDLQRTSISWQALEYFHFDKSSDWYWVLGIVALTGIVLCILFGNILLAVLILVGAVVGGMFAGKEPRMVTVEISRKGIAVENKMYEFESLESFWIEMEDIHPKIILKSKKTLMTQILIPLGEMPEDEVRAILLEYIPEVKHREPFLHKVLEYLGF